MDANATPLAAHPESRVETGYPWYRDTSRPMRVIRTGLWRAEDRAGTQARKPECRSGKTSYRWPSDA